MNSAAKQISDEIGISVQPGRRLTTIRHAVTKYRISLHVHHAVLADRRRKPPRPWNFLLTDQMAGLPMSVTGRKIVSLLER